jgi:hypothetical protein
LDFEAHPISMLLRVATALNTRKNNTARSSTTCMYEKCSDVLRILCPQYNAACKSGVHISFSRIQWWAYICPAIL